MIVYKTDQCIALNKLNKVSWSKKKKEGRQGEKEGSDAEKKVGSSEEGMQCCQAENHTKKSQNQTFIRPYFYQKSDQKRNQTCYFEVQIGLVPNTYFWHLAN